MNLKCYERERERERERAARPRAPTQNNHYINAVGTSPLRSSLCTPQLLLQPLSGAESQGDSVRRSTAFEEQLKH